LSLVGNQKEINIFDVGSHVGETLVKYKQIFPNSTVYCFEPFSISYNKLIKFNKEYKNLEIHNLAISDIEAEKELFINPDNSANSLLPLDESMIEYSKQDNDTSKVVVKTITINKFCSNNNINKIDVEGEELRALNGASDLLKNKSIKVIFTEINFLKFREGYTLFHELCSYLETFGYNLFNIYEIQTSSDGQIRWGNAIFK
jgi:FkbM family methyltransferase